MKLNINESDLRHIGTKKLSTKRLNLRKFQLDDAVQVHKNWATDEEVAKYTLWKTTKSLNETALHLNEWVKRYKSDNYYHWAIIYKETDELIGSISISSINDCLKCCNVGYTISKNYWNKGIATECLNEVLDYMILVIGMKRIYAYHDVENVASGKVMRKCGMKFVKRRRKIFFNSVKHIVDCDFYCYYV